MTAQGSAYLTALTQEIEKKLQRALLSQSQRLNLLQELFADVALEVDIRARDIILSKDEVELSQAEDGIDTRLCFYDVLADHYVRVPENGKAILDLIVQLWSQSFASHIFALLFHKWLFEVELENSEILLRYSSALVQGATNVFCKQGHLSEFASSGLGINDTKGSIYSSQALLLGKQGTPFVTSRASEKYLGLPLLSTKLSEQDCLPLINKRYLQTTNGIPNLVYRHGSQGHTECIKLLPNAIIEGLELDLKIGWLDIEISVDADKVFHSLISEWTSNWR
ncbi:hypothetical protein GIB67_029392 [Kingdonia uniflora]|uniref:Uncharacterized protein n=1 Tax=Kingdonia uniflora TaxID=39325 RepID=A0A7J7NYF8_9MAGN|nr:hypothetical protein GIB67_029392 [Kingdonia uniflora]